MCKFGAKPIPIILWNEDYQDVRVAHIDPCLASTVHELNAKGIRTIACCCAHGRWPHASIRIRSADVRRAENVGYHVIYHEGFWSIEVPYWLLQGGDALQGQCKAQEPDKPGGFTMESKALFNLPTQN